MEFLDALKTALELGWPGIVLIFLVAVWRAYERRIDAHISDLQAQISYLRELARLPAEQPAAPAVLVPLSRNS